MHGEIQFAVLDETDGRFNNMVDAIVGKFKLSAVSEVGQLIPDFLSVSPVCPVVSLSLPWIRHVSCYAVLREAWTTDLRHILNAKQASVFS